MLHISVNDIRLIIEMLFMRIFSVDTRVTKMMTMAVAVLAATFAMATIGTGLTIKPASAAIVFCNGESCVSASPSGDANALNTVKHTSTETQKGNPPQPQATNEFPRLGGVSVSAGIGFGSGFPGFCGGKPGLFTSHTNLLCAP